MAGYNKKGKRLYPKKKRRVRKARISKSIVSGSDRVLPERLITKMEIFDTVQTTLGTGGGTSAGAAYTMNGLYDYTTTLGNPAIPGFNFLSPMYKYYRVKSVKVIFRAINNSTNPLIMQIACFDNGSVNFPTWTELRQLSSNRWSKEKILSAKGGNDSGTLSLYVPMATFVGDKKVYESDDGYRGVTNASTGSGQANPTIPLLLRCYALSADGTTVVALSGMVISVNIIFMVEWFGKVALPS